MVLKKRLGHGFNGFQAPFIPRRPRSARRSCYSKKLVVDGQASAFELLATLAGKLLEESESSASSNASEGNHLVNQRDKQDAVRPLIAEGNHQGSCAESIFMTDVASQNSSQKSLPHAKTDSVLGRNSDVKAEAFEWENKIGRCSNSYYNKLVEAAGDFPGSYDGNVKNGFIQEREAGSSGFQRSTLADKFSLKDQLELRGSPALIDSNSNVKSPYCSESFPSASFSKHGNDLKLGFRDDDENFLRCNEVCTKSKAFRSPQHIAHPKIRKPLLSKYWKSSPKLKECELSKSEFADVDVKPLNHKRTASHGFETSQHNTLVKRRKFFDRVSQVTSDGGFSSESVSNSPEKGINGHNPSSSTKLHVPKDSHVKFSIKSLRIPDLYIEVPETATVGMLKRKIMEEVMAILEDSVHVGVLLQGQKVDDDNRTLVQTGISCKENLDTLSFMLEPSSLLAPAAVCVGDPSSQCETSQPTRSSEIPVLESGNTDTLHDPFLLTNPGNLIESNHDSTTSPTDTIIEKITPDSKALVAIPISPEALAVVPVNQKTKRAEIAQRRTRRPFSVTEVEALVHAVEELGTGRWRDVKLRAFENADHRTYVDLKDKWKTLVHTARISPQQRRGEQVPQELLDRVLAAHGYWSQHQAKQNGKHQAIAGSVECVQSLVMV
ncbi:PREDICTED: telomere repeat-binding protein 3-like isoform X1 [Lupinus angustifolius]|uniref:telomere repeat-binding protein 3-like isoform X1 n=1 Tax=Lupinus angustifolius TaxID=3871 RepID=UPI00092F6034|nr:PREDICTED: telomere repeat-binding protein 3-like isoform X1 [Lupinus angustifolius]